MMIRVFERIRGAATAALLATTVLVGGCGITPQQEAQIGAQNAAEINRQLPLVEDRTLNRYINLLGERIARQGDRPFDYQFFIVNTDAVNAFALPGGFIYINRGLIERTDNLAELAGVIAHEVGHVEERHGAEQIERMQRTQVGVNLAYVLMGRAPTAVEEAAINVGGTALFASYGREAEREADEVAVTLLVQSGIDPTGLVTFFKELLAERGGAPTTLEQWFSTHPLTEERIADTREVIRHIPVGQIEDLAIDSNDYEQFKARLSRYPAPQS